MKRLVDVAEAAKSMRWNVPGAVCRASSTNQRLGLARGVEERRSRAWARDEPDLAS